MKYEPHQYYYCTIIIYLFDFLCGPELWVWCVRLQHQLTQL